jgi:hypothetical protein
MFKRFIALVLAVLAYAASTQAAEDKVPGCTQVAEEIGQGWIGEGFEYLGTREIPDGQLLMFASKTHLRVLVFKMEVLPGSEKYKHLGQCKGENGMLGQVYAAQAKNEEA